METQKIKQYAGKVLEKTAKVLDHTLYSPVWAGNKVANGWRWLIDDKARPYANAVICLGALYTLGPCAIEKVNNFIENPAPKITIASEIEKEVNKGIKGVQTTLKESKKELTNKKLTDIVTNKF